MRWMILLMGCLAVALPGEEAGTPVEGLRLSAVFTPQIMERAALPPALARRLQWVLPQSGLSAAFSGTINDGRFTSIKSPNVNIVGLTSLRSGESFHCLLCDLLHAEPLADGQGYRYLVNFAYYVEDGQESGMLVTTVGFIYRSHGSPPYSHLRLDPRTIAWRVHPR